jgi:hypothetical protein
MGKYNWSELQDKRREERRPKSIKKQPKIKHRSTKGAKEDKIYLELNRKYLKEHPICECCQVAKSTEVHHRKGRGIWLLIVKYFMAICRACHREIENNPEWAKANGYSLSRLNNE